MMATILNWIATPALVIFVLCREAWRAAARTLRL
jgi:hypothetical protein